MSKRHFGFLVLLLSLMTTGAWAQTQGISFQAVLQQPDGTVPPDQTNMTVKLLVMAPSLTTTHCVLRSETHTGVNITNGYLNLVVGGPSGGTLPDGFNPASILSLNQALDNSTPRTGLHCVDGDNQIMTSGQTYTPAAGDRRILRLVVDFAPALPEVVIADFNLRSVPYAMNAETLNGKDPNSFLQVNAASKVTQANLNQFYSVITGASGNSVRWNGASFVAFDPSNGANLTAGSVPNSALASVDWSKLASVPANLSQIAGLSCATGKILKKGASAWACADETTPTETDPNVKTYAKNDPGAGLKVTSNLLQLDFATTATAGKAVQANDPRLSDARDAKPHYHSYASLQSSVGDYMKYAPNGAVCTSGQTLKWDGTKWICGTDLVGSGGGGGGGIEEETDPTVLGFAKVNPGAGLAVDGTSQVLSVQFGTTATTAVRGDDARLSDARTPIAHTHSVADVQSVAGAYFTYKPNNAPCSDGNVLKWVGGRWECGTDNEGTGSGGGSPVISWPVGSAGQFLKYSGGEWIGSTFAESDVPGLTTKLNDFTADLSTLETSVSALDTQLSGGVVKYSQLPVSSCGAHQTLAFSSPTGAWTCANIDYSAARLPAASDSGAGIVTTLAQSFAGVKSFLNNVLFAQDIDVTGAASVGTDLQVGQNINVGGGVNVDGIAAVGGLKIGVATGLACDATTAGVLRFNDTEGAIEVCDGTSWAAIGADAGGGGTGGGGGVGDPGTTNVCSLFPPVGMPCPDGSYYGGVFRYAQREHKVTTIAPPGCTLDATDPLAPILECDDDIPTDTQAMPWLLEAPTGLCGTTDMMNGRENWNLLAETDCFPDLVAPLFCSEIEVHGDGDYYLPSIEELKHLFANKKEIAGFASGVYWSSTEGATIGKAKAIDFSGSTAIVVEKNMTESAYVRCMRHHDH